MFLYLETTMFIIFRVLAALVLICANVMGTPCESSTMDIVVNSTRQLFSSPDFPSNYARPLSCKWLLEAAEGEVINIRTLTFDVYPSIFCLKDVLDIFDGNSKYAPVLQSWCGTRDADQVIQMSTHQSLVSFQAVTVGDSRQGFELEVWSEVDYVPEMGQAEYGPGHLFLAAAFSVIVISFVTAVVVVVLRERRQQRLLEESGEQ